MSRSPFDSASWGVVAALTLAGCGAGGEVGVPGPSHAPTHGDVGFGGGGDARGGGDAQTGSGDQDSCAGVDCSGHGGCVSAGGTPSCDCADGYYSNGLACLANATSLPAFPGAEGFGAAATGGRGGRVIKVTSLAAAGPGTLQAALDLDEPRIIVFDVSGVIDSDYVYVMHGDVTIAGQTAPGAGITIRGGFFSDYTPGIDNIIVRHIRVRQRPFTAASGPEDQYDSMQFSLDRLAVFDHISVAFGVDETFDLYECDDVTVQWSTIEEPSTLGADNHNYGLINGPDGWRISLHHNLFAHASARNPAIANGPAEVLNNVAYNVRHGFVHHNPASGHFNLIGNYYRQGPDDSLYPFYFDDENGGADPDLFYYLHDNYIDDPGDYVGAVDNPWAQPLLHPTFEDLGVDDSHWHPAKFDFETEYPGKVPVTVSDAETAYAQVLAKAGAWPRDSVTAQVVTETEARTGAWGARIPSDLLAGLVVGTAPIDLDEDGMADAWEAANGLDPSDPNDANTLMPSGYTAIEDYINGLADALVR